MRSRTLSLISSAPGGRAIPCRSTPRRPRFCSGWGARRPRRRLRWNRQEGWSNLRRAMSYYLQTGDVGRAVAAATHPSIVPEGAADVSEVIEPLLGDVPRGSTEEGWLRARLGAAVYFETGDYQRARAAFDRALEIAAAHREQALELRALAYETSVDHFDLRWQDVLSKSRRVLKLARRIDDLHSETYARYRAAYVLDAALDARTRPEYEVESHLARGGAPERPRAACRRLVRRLDARPAHGRVARGAGAQRPRPGAVASPSDVASRTGTLGIRNRTTRRRAIGYLHRLHEADRARGTVSTVRRFHGHAAVAGCTLDKRRSGFETALAGRATRTGPTVVDSERRLDRPGRPRCSCRFVIPAPGIPKSISSSWSLSKASRRSSGAWRQVVSLVCSRSAAGQRRRAIARFRFRPGVLPAQRLQTGAGLDLL